MEQTIRDFGNWCVQRWSPRTAAAYCWELRQLAKKYPGKGALDFRERDLNQYLAERRMFDGVHDAAIKRGVSAFKKFFKWVGKKSPAARLKYPRVVHVREPRTLNDQELESVLLSFDTSTIAGKRNIALVGLMVDCRLRAAEICRLRVDELDFESRRLSVIVKGNKRTVRKFAPETMALVLSWLSVRDAVAKSVEVKTVFVSMGGLKRTRGLALTPSGLRANFRRIGRRAGLSKFSPHDLCRTFATIATQRGGPSRVVQVGGGWSSMELVQLYTRALQVDQIDAYLPMRGKLG